MRGCGPGSIGDKLVPDKLLWICDIRLACAIHDFMYKTGQTIEDKKKADRVFLNNAQRIIGCHEYPFFIHDLLLICAYRYYRAVVKYGGPAFWKGKNKPEEVQLCQV